MTAPASRMSENDPPANGSPSTRKLPPEKKPGLLRKYAVYVWVGGAFFAIVSAAGAYSLLTRLIIGTPFTGPTWTVKKEILRVTIVERGSLESAENSDIIVRVKAGIKGSTNASTIKWVVDDGTQVKVGDPIVELDDSGYQDNLKSQRNTVNTKYAEWIQANNATAIQESTNVKDVKSAEVKLIQAQIELKKYAGVTAGTKLMSMKTQDEIRAYLKDSFDGDVQKESGKADGKFTCAYLQEVSVIEGDIEMARSDRDSWLDRAAWSARMVKKGFYSLSQSDADQSRLSATEIAVRKAQGSLDIYRTFDCEQKITAKWSDVKEAERNLASQIEVAQRSMKQKQADEAAKKSVYDQELDRLRDQERDEKFYRITAPQSGMIVYYMPEQARFGVGAQTGTVAQGEPVREGQKLIRIPNLGKMLVNARVHEAMVSKVKGEEVKATGFSEAARVGLALGRQDPLGMLASQAAFDEFHEEYKDKLRDLDQAVIFPGHRAKIRIDAFPGRAYEGHVKTVATVNSQADFLSSDVKVYQTMVSIEDLDPKSEKLKPGMSAEVTILADETKEPVLVIPIQSVMGNVTMKADRKVFVLDDKNVPHERDIVVGLSSDKLVEVISGLEEGDRIVLNPRPLIPEKSDLKAGTPSSRRGAEFDDKKGGKKKGAGPGGPGGDMPQQGPGQGKSIQRPDGAPPETPDRKSFKKMP